SRHETGDARGPRYQRIFVPLDGSPRAESVLPLAESLAHGDGSELLLVHVVPAAPLTRTAPPSVEDVELERHVRDRNTRIGEGYLATLSARLRARGIAVRTRLVEGDDPREALLDASRSEGADLVVASAHGATSRLDRSCGSVASHLAERSTIPLLLVRETLA